MIKRFALTLFLFITVGLLVNKAVKAEGTYYNIGTATSSNGSPDAVSWSQGDPIVIDSFGKFIVPIQQTGQTNYNLSFSNDDGATWDEQSGLDLPARVSVAYDSTNDTLLTLSASGNGDVTFDRFLIRRDENYNITRFTHDENITPLLVDSNGTCSDSAAGNPIILVQKVNNINKAVIFWSISKHDCNGTDLTATRAAFLNITNSGTDDDIASWNKLNGTADIGADGDANINFTQLYLANGVFPFFQQSALIKSTGSHVNDIYYFNIKETNIHQYIRVAYNNGSNFWTSISTPLEFGGNVNDSQGYNLKRELLSKPVEDTVHDSVYVGIARWLDNTNGDTQSLFYADSADVVNLAANVYSAGGTHCIYPTFDIAFDNILGKVNMFYDISGTSDVCGNVYYKTFDGTTLSAATPFYTVANRSVDIPIVYKSNYKDKLNLFFRLNNASTPGLPPHEIYYGYINTVPQEVPTTSANGVSNNEDFSYADFNKVCAEKNDVEITGAGIADIRLKYEFFDEFETPNNPYTFVYDDKWDLPSTWGAGIFEPKPNGTVNIYTNNGAYLISRQTFASNHTFSFTANFTQKNFEHIGLVDNSGFNEYMIFSTGNDGILKARTANGGGEINTVLGTSYFNSYHTYTINWTAGNLVFSIDGTNVATFTTNIPAGNMHVILSNNDHSAGSDLLVDSLGTTNFQSLTGTYTSCPIDSGIASADWLNANYGATISAGQTVEFKVRTSDDLILWSTWTDALNTGADIPSPLGRYAQYLVTLTSASLVNSPSVYDVNLTFAPPIPPDAINDPASTAFNTAVEVNVLANDIINTPLNGSSPSITVAATHGTAVVTNLAGGIITYTPTTGYSGTDTFTYRICDTDALCDTAVVNITINPEPIITPDPDPVNDGANNGVGNSAGTNTNSCRETKPGVPTILSAISTEPTKMNVKYQSGSGTFTKFEIEFTKLSQSYKDTDIVKIEKTIFEYIAKNLNPNTTYFFRIRAENGCATSDWSSEFKAVTSTEKTTISTSSDIGKTPVSSPVESNGFKTEYLLIICCPLAIVLLIIFASRKKKDNKSSTDFNERFK